MTIFRKLVLSALGIAIAFSSCSQVTGKRFHEQIEAFRIADLKNPPPENAIVFVGSSSFAIWQKVSSYFPGYTIINRGFGGSRLDDAIEYEDEIIAAYKPRQVVIYSGENDIAENVSAGDVCDRFRTLFKMIRQDVPGANIVYVSIKPSPSREKYMPVMVKANAMIKKFLSQQENTVFVDVYSKMLDASGKPRPELFGKDMLHMKSDGYRIWADALRPHLLK